MAKKIESIDDKKTRLTAAIIAAAIKGKKTGSQDRTEDLIEALWELARQDGKDDLAIDLWDAEEISEEGVEFMIENNGVSDPRKVVKRG